MSRSPLFESSLPSQEPTVLEKALDAAYAEMAQDEDRESAALEWAEATFADVIDTEKVNHAAW